jgi:hypothetical protein
MIQDDCEMLEPGDLEKPREQLERDFAVLRELGERRHPA